MVDFKELQEQTLWNISISEDKKEIVFETIEGNRYVQYHDQDCCEVVEVEEIVGDLEDLIGSPILLAEEVIHENESPEGISLPEDSYDDSFTWTFYKLATIKGTVTIRWYGESNGYCSEEVDFVKASSS